LLVALLSPRPAAADALCDDLSKTMADSLAAHSLGFVTMHVTDVPSTRVERLIDQTSNAYETVWSSVQDLLPESIERAIHFTLVSRWRHLTRVETPNSGTEPAPWPRLAPRVDGTADRARWKSDG